MTQNILRVRLVGEMKNCEEKKLQEDGKVGGQKRFQFPLFLFVWKWKSRGMEKVSLYKFTHIPLLKNDAQLKRKTHTHTHTHTQNTKESKRKKEKEKKRI